MAWTVKDNGDIETGDDLAGVTYRRHFILIADNDNETVHTARLAPGVPQKKESHPEYPYAGCSGRDVEQRRRSKRVFDLYANYATRLRNSEDPDVEIANPLLRPSRRSFSFTPIRESSYMDVGGSYFRNSAGEPIQREIEDDILILNIIRNEAIHPPFYYDEYNNTINNDTFLDSLPGQLFMSIDHGEEQNESGIYFMQVSYSIAARPLILLPAGTAHVVGFTWPTDGVPANYYSRWDSIELDRGFYYWAENPLGPEAPPIRFPFIDADTGQPPSEPQLLDGSGGPLPKPETIEDKDKYITGTIPDAMRPHWIINPGFFRSNFADLNLLAT